MLILWFLICTTVCTTFPATRSGKSKEVATTTSRSDAATLTDPSTLVFLATLANNLTEHQYITYSRPFAILIFEQIRPSK